MTERVWRGVTVRISPWFPGMLLLTWVVLWAFLAATSSILPPVAPASTLAVSLGATLLLLVTVMVHEAGHVLAAAAHGHKLVLVNLGAGGVGVGFIPDQPRGWPRIIRSLAGPAAQILVSLPAALTILAEPIFSNPTVVAPFQHALLWVPGIFGVGVALINLLPFPGCDGAKMLQGLRDLRAGT